MRSDDGIARERLRIASRRRSAGAEGRGVYIERESARRCWAPAADLRSKVVLVVVVVVIVGVDLVAVVFAAAAECVLVWSYLVYRGPSSCTSCPRVGCIYSYPH